VVRISAASARPARPAKSGSSVSLVVSQSAKDVVVGFQPCKVNSTGTGTRSRFSAGVRSRWRRASRSIRIAAELLPVPGPPVMISRPEARPP